MIFSHLNKLSRMLEACVWEQHSKLSKIIVVQLTQTQYRFIHTNSYHAIKRLIC